MYELGLYRNAEDELARLQLARDFPNVPTRIINSVLAAYRRVTPSVAEAFRAAHDRIADARAT